MCTNNAPQIFWWQARQQTSIAAVINEEKGKRAAVGSSTTAQWHRACVLKSLIPSKTKGFRGRSNEFLYPFNRDGHQVAEYDLSRRAKDFRKKRENAKKRLR